MEIEKILKKIMKQRSSSNAHVLVAVTAGLGLGAVLGLLFAPESGKVLRDKLGAACVSNTEPAKSEENTQEKPVESLPAKKPKSDIKEIIHQAHIADAHSDETKSTAT